MNLLKLWNDLTEWEQIELVHLVKKIVELEKKCVRSVQGNDYQTIETKASLRIIAEKKED